MKVKMNGKSEVNFRLQVVRFWPTGYIWLGTRFLFFAYFVFSGKSQVPFPLQTILCHRVSITTKQLAEFFLYKQRESHGSS